MQAAGRTRLQVFVSPWASRRIQNRDQPPNIIGEPTDLIEGIFRLAMSELHGPVNIGNLVEMMIRQFAEKIIQITGAKLGIKYRDLPVNDPKVRQPEITRAPIQLNWEPKVEFDEGIRVTIDYFRKNWERDLQASHASLMPSITCAPETS
jgi:nucleoside-diphosphate-sugar epimerase